MIERKKCVVCDSVLNTISVQKNFPIYMGVREKNEASSFQDMRWGCCQNCGCVQLKEMVEPEILYKKPHNPAVGKTWERHHQQFADLIKSFKCENVLEIGGANLRLANLVCDENVKIYDILDYSSGSYATERINDKINLIKGTIETYKSDVKLDAVILSHTFEHIYEPKELLRVLRTLLAPTGKIFISSPNMKNQLQDKFMNAINFEHTFYMDPDYVREMACYCGFIVDDVRDFSKYNNFYVLSPTELGLYVVHPRPRLAEMIFLEFLQHVAADVEMIKNLCKKKKVYSFGAHIFNQYLLNMGLPEKKISYILDNDKDKVDKYLYGTDLRVQSPDRIRKDKNPVILLRVSQYKDEIQNQLLELNPDAIFI